MKNQRLYSEYTKEALKVLGGLIQEYRKKKKMTKEDEKMKEGGWTYWNYRVIKTLLDDHYLYEIVEVYYTDGVPTLFGSASLCSDYSDGDEPLEPLATTLDLMKGALDKPVLDRKDFDDMNNQYDKEQCFTHNGERYVKISHVQPTIDALRKQIAELETKLSGVEKDAQRYQWIKDNIKEELTPKSLINPTSEHKTMYVLPKIIAWADFCGQIEFDDAIDYQMEDDD